MCLKQTGPECESSNVDVVNFPQKSYHVGQTAVWLMPGMKPIALHWVPVGFLGWVLRCCPIDVCLFCTTTLVVILLRGIRTSLIAEESWTFSHPWLQSLLHMAQLLQGHSSCSVAFPFGFDSARKMVQLVPLSFMYKIDNFKEPFCLFSCLLCSHHIKIQLCYTVTCRRWVGEQFPELLLFQFEP